MADLCHPARARRLVRPARGRDRLGPQELRAPGGGRSAIQGPDERIIAGPHTGLEERLVIGEIDLDQLQAAKLQHDPAGHCARPEVLRTADRHRAEDSAGHALGGTRGPLNADGPLTSAPFPSLEWIHVARESWVVGGEYAWFRRQPTSVDGYDTINFDRSAGPATRRMRSA